MKQHTTVAIPNKKIGKAKVNVINTQTLKLLMKSYETKIGSVPLMKCTNIKS